MRKLTQFIVSIFLIVFLINTTYGFPGMAKNNSNVQTGNITQSDQNGVDLKNTTKSDQNIVLIQHLIEVDAVSLQSENRLFVRETLIFRNIGTENFSGFLRTWIPDEAQDIKLNRSEMMTGGGVEPLPFIQNGNIISWQDFIEKNSVLPDLYMIEYTLGQEARGTFSQIEKYSKKLTYPTLINYQYMQKPGLPAVVLKITKPDGSSVTLMDENRNKISPTEVSEEGNSIINRFNSPQFKELNIEISKPVIPSAQLAGYVIIGLVILLALSYPIIRKRSEKLQAFEEKIRNALKREETTEEMTEETVEAAAPEIAEELISQPAGEAVVSAEDVTEFEGKTKDELEVLRAETLSELDELEKEYSSGNLLDEEYEELRESYREKVESIARILKRIG